MPNSNSTEFDPSCEHKIIEKLNFVTKEEIDEMGFKISRKLRIGARKIDLKENSEIREIYQKSEIFERFRHRYSFNLKYRELFEKNGIEFVGVNK